MVSILWPNLHKEGLEIDFSYTPFKWSSEANKTAQVFCVIIGFSMLSPNKTKLLFENGQVKIVNNINPYLVDGPDIVIKRIRKPLSNVSRLHKGCQPTDGGNLIIERDEYNDFVKKEPKAKKYIKKLIGASEYLNNRDRYCLWLVDASPKEIRSMPSVMQRIEKTKNMRLAAKSKGTQKLAETPHLFRETYNYNQYIVLPMVNSNSRKYLPIGFFDKTTISTNLNLISEICSVYNLGVLSSNVHMAWTKYVCGRMGDSIRYSAGVVYNNFPWPKATEEQKTKIENTAKRILEVRASFPDSSLADLYDDLTMPPELRKAHQENDKAVMEAYGFDWRKMAESECVGELMKMYQKLTEE